MRIEILVQGSTTEALLETLKCPALTTGCEEELLWDRFTTEAIVKELERRRS